MQILSGIRFQDLNLVIDITKNNSVEMRVFYRVTNRNRNQFKQRVTTYNRFVENHYRVKITRGRISSRVEKIFYITHLFLFIISSLSIKA